MAPIEPERLGARDFFGHPLAAAMLTVVGENGLEAATVGEICAAAEVDRAGFDALFPDKEAAMLRTFEAYIEDFEAHIAAAYNAAAPRWPDNLRTAAYALVNWIGSHPFAPQFGMVEVHKAEEMARVRLEGVLCWCAELIDGGRAVAPDPGSIPQTAPLIVVGSVAQIVGREGPRFSADKDRVERFNKLVPEMMYTAVRPYLGEEAAKRELTIPPPEAELASRAGECNCPHLRHTVEAVNTPQEPREGSRGLPRLPPGRHGLSREFVVENQRQRLAAGMIQAVAKRGYNSATVSDIAAASGVSRRSFYGYFDSKEECFSDTYAMVADFLFGVMAEAGESERGWPARVRAELTAMLEVFAANPDLASFSLIAPSAAGGTVAERYRDFLGRLVAVLGEGRPQNARRPSEAAEHGLVGGLAGLVVEQVKAGQGKNLSALLPDLLELVLTPYLGRAKAVKEARRK